MAPFKKVLITGVMVLGAIAASNTFAQETTSEPAVAAGSPTTPGKHHHHHHRGGFFLGICVGQALAKANVSVVPGKHDPAVKKAIHDAKEACKAAFKASHKPSSGS